MKKYKDLENRHKKIDYRAPIFSAYTPEKAT